MKKYYVVTNGVELAGGVFATFEEAEKHLYKGLRLFPGIAAGFFVQRMCVDSECPADHRRNI